MERVCFCTLYDWLYDKNVQFCNKKKLKRRFQYTLSKKSIYVIALVMALIVIAALTLLSVFMAKQTRLDNQEFARKSFQYKLEAVEKVFQNIQDDQVLIKNLVQKSNVNTIQEHFSMLNDLNKNRNLKKSNWFFVTSGNGVSKNRLQSEALSKEQYKSEVEWRKLFEKDSISNFIVKNKTGLYWVSYDSIRNASHQYIYFGTMINLLDLHHYFTQMNLNQSNYAYVFTKDGTCIMHPEQQFIGKNVFRFTDIKPKDTLTSRTPDGNTVSEANSEFLGLMVTRFISPLKTKNFDGYVSVNYANLLIDENVDKIKKYITFVFVATFLLISLVFILFNKVTNLAYIEKEKIEKKNNELLVDIEKIQKNNAINQLQQLKNQINPHFLFNSLNSLYMLIGLDTIKAQKFTMNLSKMYRYLIVPPKDNWVLVKDELSFIHHYMDLQKSRFEDEIQFSAHLDHSKNSDFKIPYLSLQIAVENAIKHNVATLDSPLEIRIFDNNKGIFVSNSYQPKQINPEGEQFGLQYLQKIYAFYKNNEFYYHIKNQQFVVFIPFLD